MDAKKPGIEVTKHIVANVRRRKEQLRMTQAAIADLVGMEESNFSRMLKAGQVMTTETLVNLADALGVKPQHLVGRLPIPMFGDDLACGPFRGTSDASGEVGPAEWIGLEELFDANADLCVFTADGTSMVNAGINPGDRLVVQPATTAKAESLVVVRSAGEYTVKKWVHLRVEGRRTFGVVSCDGKSTFIPNDEVTIVGIVVGIVKSAK